MRKTFYSILIAAVALAGCRSSKDLSGTPGRQQVKFGVCASLATSEILKNSGYAFLEASVGRDLMPGQPVGAWNKKKAEFDTCRLPVLSCNGFLPGELKTTGPEAHQDTVLKYAEVAFRRAQAAGIPIIVFGSGGSRSIPEGFDRQAARGQFVGLLKEMGPVARKYGVTIAIENLQSSECNFINTVGEALDIAREVADPNVGLLVDIFHMARENENPDILIRAGKLVRHVHIAEKEKRTAPGMAGDDFRPYFACLKRAGYRGGISIEGQWKPENLEKALRVMSEQWKSSF